MDNCCGESLGQVLGKMPTQKPQRMEIQRVSNGFIVTGYGVKTMIANTLEEAVALLKKEME